MTPPNKKNKKKWFTQALTNHRSFKDFFEPVVQLIKPHWQAKEHAALVTDNRVESELVYSLVLKPAKGWPRHIAGQHLSIQIEINGVRYHRIFSISSSPHYHQQTGLIELTIRQQDQGKVTQWMAKHIHNGSVIRVSPPQGKFTLPNHTKPLLLIAGGSGITPFRSFLQQLADNDSQQDVHLVYYNQSVAPLFANEWSELQQTLSHLKVSLIDTDISGLISSKQIIETCADFLQREAYLCGPHGLITTSRDLLIELGVENQNIHHELFGPKPVSRNSTSTNTTSLVTFTQSNTAVKPTSQQSLLDLAEHAQLNPPSGCRMGVCHQCKCSKKQGVVYNTLTETYSDTGTEDIQLCISVAVGDVTLDL